MPHTCAPTRSQRQAPSKRAGQSRFARIAPNWCSSPTRSLLYGWASGATRTHSSDSRLGTTGHGRRDSRLGTLDMAAEPSNSAIADALDELGDLYELDGAIVHRVLAYRTAAKVVRDSPVSVAALTREGRVTELAGIGTTLEEKIRALLDTGDIPAAVKLRERFPPGL